MLTGSDASEERLREMDASGELARYRFIHLAVHGYLNTQAPALSAVVLSQFPRSERYDGYVTASEWPAFTLHSELMVLSACETGLGRVVQGEGVIGLPYALFVAGNRDAVLTLSGIPDRDSAAFVVAFFRRIAAGQAHARALNATQREFERRSGQRFPTWAAFQLHGSPDH